MICKYCNENLTEKDWAMVTKENNKYSCIKCSDKALKEFKKKY